MNQHVRIFASFMVLVPIHVTSFAAGDIGCTEPDYDAAGQNITCATLCPAQTGVQMFTAVAKIIATMTTS